MPLDAVDPELGLRVIRAVRLARDRVDPAHALVHAADARRGRLGGRAVPERRRRDVVRGPPQPVERPAAVVRMLRDAGHRERMERLHDQRTQPADERNRMPDHPPRDRLRARARPTPRPRAGTSRSSRGRRAARFCQRNATTLKSNIPCGKFFVNRIVKNAMNVMM